MSLRTDEREWDELAVRDALWAVLSVPNMRGNWTEEDFIRSGEHEVSGVLAGLAEAGYSPRKRAALDFGCGAGRLTRALSSRFETAVGVDISPEMVARASHLTATQPNCEFHVNRARDLKLFTDSRFDFVLSLISLQHVSDSAAVRQYVSEFVRVTAPDGIIVFQVPASVGWQIRAHPLRLVNRLVRRLPYAPEAVLRWLLPYSMRLVALPEAVVRDTLSEAGARLITAFPDGRSGSDAVVSLSYVAVVV